MSRRLRRLACLAPLLLLCLPPGAEAQRIVDGPVETAYEPSAVHAGVPGRMALRGPWAVRLDPGNDGALKGWQTGAFRGKVVRLPYSPNAKVVAGYKGIKSFRGNVAWFRTTFKVPADGEYALRYESIHHDATVWLDGRILGRHTGVYLPFEHKVPLAGGETHTLVVRADYRGPTRQKRAGWHRTWFNFGGINREITIRPVGPSELSNPTLQTRLTDAGAAVVDVTVHVRNRAAEARPLQVIGALRRSDQHHALVFPKLMVAPRTTRIFQAQVTIPQPALWEPGAPNLYDLDLVVQGESAYKQRVGLRELRWTGPRLELNRKRLRLHGASIHEDVHKRGDALRPADHDAIVTSLQRIGANATRSQHPLHPALLERFDAAGILVWLGLGPVDAPGAWTAKTPKQQKIARERVRISFRQAQVNPSIIAWNLANEVAGNGHPDGQAAYVDDMARELHLRDPGRLVAVDVWGAHPPRGALGLLYRNVDAIAVTNYVGWYEIPLAPRARVARGIRAATASFARTFAGKVLIVSEFGAEANGMNATDRPGGYAFQVRVLRQHINAYRAQPDLSGMLVWNLRDFAVSPAFAGGSISRLVPGIRLVRGVNQKGLFDHQGRPKPSVSAVAALFGLMGTGLGG